MRKQTTKWMAVVAAIWACESSAAAPAQWYYNVAIKYVYSGQAGGRMAVGITTTVTAGTCPNSNEFTIDATNPHAARILAMLIAAQVAGSTVNIYTNGDCTSWGVLATDVALGSFS
jgi:urease alpha subunit